MDRPNKNRRPAGKPGSDRRKSNSDKSPRGRKSAGGPRREGSERDENRARPQSGGRPGGRPNRPGSQPNRPGGRPNRPAGKKFEDRPRRDGDERQSNRDGENRRPKRDGEDRRPKREGGERHVDRSRRGGAFKTRPNAWRGGDPKGKPFRKHRPKKDDSKGSADTRLNKYLAHAGVASRREADNLIATGLVQVNGKVVTEMGYKVQPNDEVRFNNERISPERKVYVLLNKPKDFITTVDDPQNRKTVMQLVQGHGPERIYPVGRLDRMTTGLLMFTNDGDLAKRLTHPSYQVRKVYHVVLDQTLKPNHLDDIRKGIKLEDGPIAADEISYIEGASSRKEIGIEIHSGRNRIVRRIFEHLGYKVVRLDRVVFANLTKRNLKRGQWRFLSREELQQMAMMGKAK